MLGPEVNIPQLFPDGGWGSVGQYGSEFYQKWIGYVIREISRQKCI